MNRRRLSIVVGLCALVLVGCWSLMRMSSADPRPDGSGTCALATLPPEVGDTVRNIHRDGPFPFPRNDGVVFGNREGHLPQREKGYYHEYTVVTPGAGNRSTKRIVTGGTPLRNPAEYFYTSDHYDSFCQVPDAGGQR